VIPRGGPTQDVGEVLARARERAGVREIPTVGEAAAPPASAPSSSDDKKGEGPPRHEPKICSSCSAPIFWGQLPSRKSMPVNAEPSADGNVRLVDRKGSVLAFVLTGDELARARAAGDRLRTSHFADCPAAAKHRRKKPMARDVRPATKQDVERELARPAPADCDPDWTRKCESCGASPVMPATGMCGPCTFGEANTAGGEW
jgi:hypothetical protein